VNMASPSGIVNRSAFMEVAPSLSG